MLFVYLYIFVVGLVLGSFYNVVGLRVPIGQSIVRPRSACPACRHTLAARELVPVLSYMWQKGRCRSCRARISPRYAAMELLTGLLFMAAFWRWGLAGEVWVVWTMISLLIIVTISDLSYMLIPNKLLISFFPIFLLERLLLPLQPWWDSLAGAAAAFALLFCIAWASKGGMGGGDIKLFALLGFVLGVKLVLLSFLLAAFFGTIAGLAGMIGGRVQRGKPIPFAPSIAAGTLAAYFFGPDLIAIYLSLLE
ncbi:prepilin peptidase [Ectobacillus ponti]|uniref:Prepilin peptidase n=1 Tax=Ectobacillus ponti TaxID=2961894 RepID=A0AA42BPJ5_9BACI|nr:A24 family peptidase [Ectobacillus ponti]MCP8968501.1 prepilin peptidase [Ectobacillus ponti]